MNVLLTNDDGIYSPGLEAIYEELKKIAKTNPQYKDYWKRFEEENKEEVA